MDDRGAMDQARELSERAGRRMMGSAQEVAQRAGKYAQSRLADVSERAKELSQVANSRVEEMTGRRVESWVEEAQRLVRERPLTAIAVTIGLGYLIGKLTARD